MAKQRIEYIDALRGFCMILVVLYHIGMFSYGMGLPGSYYHIFNFFMLPLFFFVSGWCCYRKEAIVEGRNAMRFCARKFQQLFVPSFLFMVFSVFVFRLNFFDTLFNEWKAGYWFTYVLFFFFLFYVIVMYALSHISANERTKDGVLFLIALAAFVICFHRPGGLSGLTLRLYLGQRVYSCHHYSRQFVVE